MLTTIESVLETLVASNRTTPCGIVYVVEPRHNKNRIIHLNNLDLLGTKIPNPYYDKSTKSWLIEKLGELVGFVGGQYGSIVNNQRAREEIATDFIPLPLWPSKDYPNGAGVHLNNFIVEHVVSHKRYLKVMPQSVQIDDSFAVKAKIQYRWKETGIPLSDEQLTLLATFEPQTATSSRQETDKPIFWQTIAIDNLLELRFGREIYTITKNDK